MAPTPGAFCSQCGAPLQPNQRFCTNCGTNNEIHVSSPTMASQAPITPPGGGASPGAGNAVPPTIPPAPPGVNNQSYVNRNETIAPPPPPPTYNPYANSMAQNYAQTTTPDVYTPPPGMTPPAQAGAYQVPVYAQKQKSNRGCLIGTSIVLLLVLALGVGGYFLLHSLLNGSSNGNNTGTNSTSNSGNGNNASQGHTPTTGASSLSAQQVNLQITYAGVHITIVSTQLANAFSDDTSTTAGSAGIVRVNLRENNPTTSNPDYLERDSFLLLLPGGTTIQPSNSQQPISPEPGVNRQNWLDFPLASQVTLNQLTLRIGTQKENQMDVPLQSKANINKYQDRTSTPNTAFKYGPLNMTLKSATLSYSFGSQQATAGNLYLIVTLAAVNNTNDTIDTYPSSEMRLQAGGNTMPPENSSSFPFYTAANASSSGTVIFLVPQGTTSFTLVLLAQATSPAIAQATQAFQVQ